MVFNSIEFLVFMPVVTILYFVIPIKYRNPWLLLCSYFFYACWNPKYTLLMMVSTGITYLSGVLLYRYRENLRLKHLWVFLSFASNLSILVFFKYFGFFADNVAQMMALIGVEIIVPQFDVVLPVGISFYTFQALSYTMDVYRGNMKAEYNFITYALFVSFFPQLVAGPIERSTNLLPQFRETHTFDWDRLQRGFAMMLYGLFLKMIVADRVAITVDVIYGDVTLQSGMAILFATFLFAFQIYCDFGGYSNIAIGAAHIMGFELMRNFRQPYLSTSVRMFWRRWHISLNTWFTDYLYIPLGGGHCSKARKYLNITITFGLSGLWHGANWGFVIWGLLNGIYIIIEDILKTLCEKLHLQSKKKRLRKAKTAVHIIITFLMVDFAWLFFRARTMENAMMAISMVGDNLGMTSFINGAVSLLHGEEFYGLDIQNYCILAVGILIIIIVDIIENSGASTYDKLMQRKIAVRWTVYFIGIFSVLIYGVYGFDYDAVAFIYFQF